MKYPHIPIARIMKSGRSIMLLLLLVIQGFSSLMAADGAAIFKQNCTACHAIDKQVVGPALKDVHKRRDEAWLIKFIKNSTAVINGGDKYAVDLYNKFNKTQMPAFDYLQDDEIKAVIAYIVEKSEAPAEVAAAPAAGGAAPESGSTGIPTTTLFWGLAALTGVLILIIFLLIFITTLLVNALKEKEAREKNVPVESLKQSVNLLKNKFVATAILFILVIAGFNYTVKTARAVGVHQGYAPVQPIAFSHQLHAGTNQIQCQTCHTGVEKSKSANIPSTNICMNCHSYVKKESPEIQKLYKAMETGTPVEWVRIHNLPDFVYFNHQQHVKVGGVECQECHGPIEEMEVVYQYSPLTMGWCIDCHRKKEVDLKKNDYYLKIHEKMKGTEEVITVEKLGGLECAKCHY
jgi:mono/diheme cytochrome c family protein